jgi:DNA-binding transcriptional regulator WhiA
MEKLYTIEISNVNKTVTSSKRKIHNIFNIKKDLKIIDPLLVKIVISYYS